MLLGIEFQRNQLKKSLNDGIIKNTDKNQSQKENLVDKLKKYKNQIDMDSMNNGESPQKISMLKSALRKSTEKTDKKSLYERFYSKINITKYVLCKC